MTTAEWRNYTKANVGAQENVSAWSTAMIQSAKALATLGGDETLAHGIANRQYNKPSDASTIVASIIQTMIANGTFWCDPALTQETFAAGDRLLQHRYETQRDWTNKQKDGGKLFILSDSILCMGDCLLYTSPSPRDS